MNIYDYLTQDHKKVSDLFKQFEKSKNVDHKKDFVELIIRELTLHAESEQLTFYKMLEKFDESRDIALHAEKEHREIEDLMDEIKKMHITNNVWEDKVEELKKIVDHHVKEEESKIFKQAKKVLSEEEAYSLKEKMHYLKGKLSANYAGQENGIEKM